MISVLSSGLCEKNGYETTSIFNSTFFGHVKGPYIDNYVINEKHGGICTLLDEAIMRWAFWGYCRIMEVIGGKATPFTRETSW